MSRIRANTITNQNANGAPNFPDGITVTGVVTATTTNQNITGDLSVTGNIGVGGTLTYEDVTNIDSVGIVTARSGIRVTSTTAGIAVGTNAMVSGRADNVLHLHKASGGTADGPTIYFTNQQTGVTANDGLTIGLNDSQSPYFWNRENTATRFGTNNAERLRIGPAGQIGLGGANYGSSGQVLTSQGSSSAAAWSTIVSGILQVKQVRFTGTQATTSSYANISGLSITMTPTNVNTQMLVIMSLATYHGNSNSQLAARIDGAGGYESGDMWSPGSGVAGNITQFIMDDHNSTSAQTYTAQIKHETGSGDLNKDDNGTNNGICTLTVIEINSSVIV